MYLRLTRGEGGGEDCENQIEGVNGKLVEANVSIKVYFYIKKKKKKQS